MTLTRPWSERKELLRLLIADVTVTRQTNEILVQLRWVTNQVDTWTVPLPRRGARTSPGVLDRIRELASSHTDADIAICLNAEGWVTAHGESFTAQRVHALRREHRMLRYYVPRKRVTALPCVSKGAVMNGHSGCSQRLGWSRCSLSRMNSTTLQQSAMNLDSSFPWQ
jgi:hypothetical protein